MRTKLVSVTPDAEKLILYIARVSSDQDKTDTGLLGYLIRNGHWSPFEMVHAVWEIETSRVIAQQILRHRSFSFQEFSQRYATATRTEIYDARRAGATNRQGSIDDLDEDTAKWFLDAQVANEKRSFDDYHHALARGIAPECARFLLPQSTGTRLYMAGSLRSWIHYLGDGPGGRGNEHTQKEHRDIALEIRSTFTEQFPVISEALGWIPERI